MQLSDDLAKADLVSEGTVSKLIGSLASLLDRNMEKLESNLSANGSMWRARRRARVPWPGGRLTAAVWGARRRRHTVSQARWTSTWSRSSGTRPSTRSRTASGT